MKQILLTKGKYALVDDADFESLNRFKWCVVKSGKTFGAMRQCKCLFGGKYHAIYMHRQLMSTPCGMETDHIDHDGLNNQRGNLRICTRSQNQQNAYKDPEKFSSKYKGVTWFKVSKKWQVAIQRNNKRIYLGSFNSEIEAARAYDAKAKELFGEFSCLNFDKKRVG